jgi:hypothetical protein
VSVEVKKPQHRYVIDPKDSGLTEILATTGVSVEVLPSDNFLETITLCSDSDKLGPALTMVYAKVNRHLLKCSTRTGYAVLMQCNAASYYCVEGDYVT